MIKTIPADINIRGPLNAYSAYGQLICRIARMLMKLGYRVVICPTNTQGVTDRTYDTFVGPDIEAISVEYFSDPKFEIYIGPPTWKPVHKSTVYFTMHESTRLGDAQTANVLAAELLIAPTEKCLEWLTSNFPSPAIEIRPATAVVPLGIDMDAYGFEPSVPRFDDDHEFRIGMAGRFTGVGERKNLEAAIKAFDFAYTGNPQIFPRDSRLIVHVYPDHPPMDVPKNVTIHREFIEHMQGFYQHVDVILTPSAGEAWNMVAHEAAACARPVLLPWFGGFLENRSFDRDNPGFIGIPFRLDATNNPYYPGFQAVITPDDIKEAFKQLRFDRDWFRQAGVSAYRAVHHLTTSSMVIRLLDVLEHHNYL